MHFAASSYVGESVINPQKYYENNVVGSLSLLQRHVGGGLSQDRVFELLRQSTANLRRVPIREDGTARSQSIRMVHRRRWSSASLPTMRAPTRFSSIALRYFNASGADPDGELGELRDPETHLIPRAMMAIQGYIPDFAVFGTDYDTPMAPLSGTTFMSLISPTRTLQRCEDFLQAVRAALQSRTGRGYSVKQVLDAIAAETGEELTVSNGPRRPGDPPVLVADASLSRD